MRQARSDQKLAAERELVARTDLERVSREAEDRIARAERARGAAEAAKDAAELVRDGQAERARPRPRRWPRPRPGCTRARPGWPPNAPTPAA